MQSVGLVLHCNSKECWCLTGPAAGVIILSDMPVLLLDTNKIDAETTSDLAQAQRE